MSNPAEVQNHQICSPLLQLLVIREAPLCTQCRINFVFIFRSEPGRHAPGCPGSTISVHFNPFALHISWNFFITFAASADPAVGSICEYSLQYVPNASSKNLLKRTCIVAVATIACCDACTRKISSPVRRRLSEAHLKANSAYGLESTPKTIRRGF